mmetsp:Transcript_9620/g.27272  ORF Transcript_9620/g.27272 Transcript_9620/m.27272 type:complete len:237 (-) Transcript_9620:898-1608(-)
MFAGAVGWRLGIGAAENGSIGCALDGAAVAAAKGSTMARARGCCCPCGEGAASVAPGKPKSNRFWGAAPGAAVLLATGAGGCVAVKLPKSAKDSNDAKSLWAWGWLAPAAKGSDGVEGKSEGDAALADWGEGPVNVANVAKSPVPADDGSCCCCWSREPRSMRLRPAAEFALMGFAVCDRARRAAAPPAEAANFCLATRSRSCAMALSASSAATRSGGGLGSGEFWAIAPRQSNTS